MMLYIVIHIIYLCEKPDSIDFPNFLIQKRILRVKLLHISDIFSRRFSIKGKMPDYCSDLFFLFSFRLQSSTLIGPLFTILRKAPEAKSAQCKRTPKGPPFHFFTFSRKQTKPDVPKGSPLWIFFGTVRLFFRNFLMSPKGPPFEFFDILQRNVC